MSDSAEPEALINASEQRQAAFAMVSASAGVLDRSMDRCRRFEFIPARLVHGPHVCGEQVRQQAGVIPFRGTGKKLEICLIRRKGSKKWGIPKGFVDRGDNSKDAALKEALEEAGLKGRLVGEPVGNYEYRKWGTKLDVTVYLMEVHEEQDDWHEADVRERQWTSLKDATELLEQHPVQPLIGDAKERLS